MKRMKKVVGVIISAGIMVASFTIMASAETGVLTNTVVMCEKRDTAFSATVVFYLLQEKNVAQDVIEKALDERHCFLANSRDTKLKIHRKTKGTVEGKLVHYAEVSVISVGTNVVSEDMQAKKMWIAMPYNNNGLNMLKLDNGKYW